MTTKVTIICAAAALVCTGTALKAAIALVHREAYIVSWWDASIAGTGRSLGGARVILKLVTMLAVAVACALVLARVIVPSQVWYVVIPAGVVSALSELTAAKPQRSRR